MKKFDFRKYQAFEPIRMTGRRWPDRVIDRAPRWCSVDLRDGNQALVKPMTAAQKLHLWDQLVRIGFREIEVGFPAASSHDYDFIRKLIDEDRIPEDVRVQVLTQARPAVIEKTFASLNGVRRAIVHMYNSTSKVQRDQVFGLDRQGIIDIATRGAELVKRTASRLPNTEWIFQYSPESFTGTELDFAVEICNTVSGIWQPTPARKVILNLPATVEMSTPNVYADQIEWFCSHIDKRDSVQISVHTHNDRGCAVAAAELAVMAGAERVEGTLFGNGERTGNMDIITMAMNLYSQGVDPELDFSRIDEIIRHAQQCTQLPIHPRHPYAGELVFTAFSGSHQDAIKKCLARRDEQQAWQVAYLPIDPADLGRSYQEVIRINSQSGKGGVAYVLERDYSLQLPRWMQVDFSATVQRFSEKSQAEVSTESIWSLFQETYLSRKKPWRLASYQVNRRGGVQLLQVELRCDSTQHVLTGSGRGVVEAFVQAMQRFLGRPIVLVEYSEHALRPSDDFESICYIQLNIDGERYCGVGQNQDIIQASLDGILGAINARAVEPDQGLIVGWPAAINREPGLRPANGRSCLPSR